MSRMRVTDSAVADELLAGDQPDAHDQGQTVGDAHDEEHEGQQPGVPEGHALAVAHGEAAVDGGHHAEDAGQDHEAPSWRPRCPRR